MISLVVLQSDNQRQLGFTAPHLCPEQLGVLPGNVPLAAAQRGSHFDLFGPRHLIRLQGHARGGQQALFAAAQLLNHLAVLVDFAGHFQFHRLDAELGVRQVQPPIHRRFFGVFCKD